MWKENELDGNGNESLFSRELVPINDGNELQYPALT